jgi:hypothetical protein
MPGDAEEEARAGGEDEEVCAIGASAAPPGHLVELGRPEDWRFPASWWTTNDGEGSRVELRELARWGCCGFGQGGGTSTNLCGR